MPGFSSMDDLINEMTTNGKMIRTDWNKNIPIVQAAGLWYDLFGGSGNPPAQSVYGSGGAANNRIFRDLFDPGLTTTAPGISATGMPHGGNVSPDYKFIINASAYTAAATTVPCVLMLVDVLGFYPILTCTLTGNQACTGGLTSTNAWPRYTDGAGVRAFVVPSTVMGAGTPQISITYTNSAGVTGRTTPGALPVGNTTAVVSNIVYTGTGVGKYGPFLPLAPGDAGIQSVQAFNLSSTYSSGVLNLVLCKPLLTLPITTLGVAAERDLLNQVPSLPRVYDGACLSWLIYAGANTPANSAFYGHLDFVYG